LRCEFIFLNFPPGLLDLRLGFGSRLSDDTGSRLERFLTSSFLMFE